jgi:tRNA dimethylallyltransferase
VRTVVPLLAIVGPTASGKTEASILAAEALGAEILCVDSMLVYRGMDTGTAKPTAEQRSRVPHHLVDVADPADPASVAWFQALAARVESGIRARGAAPLVVSGGGLYYRAVVDGLEFPGTDRATRRLLETEARALPGAALHGRLAEMDPAAAARIDPSNLRRTIRALEVQAITGRPFSSFAVRWSRYPADAVRAVGIDVPRDVLHRRIEARVSEMLPGLLEETRALAERGFEGFLTSTQAIGYAEAVGFLRGTADLDRVASDTVRRTKALARRQLAWLRRDPRIRWIPAGTAGAVEVVDQIIGHLSEGSHPPGRAGAGPGRAAPAAAGSAGRRS